MNSNTVVGGELYSAILEGKFCLQFFVFEFLARSVERKGMLNSNKLADQDLLKEFVMDSTVGIRCMHQRPNITALLVWSLRIRIARES